MLGTANYLMIMSNQKENSNFEWFDDKNGRDLFLEMISKKIKKNRIIVDIFDSEDEVEKDPDTNMCIPSTFEEGSEFIHNY